MSSIWEKRVEASRLEFEEKAFNLPAAVLQAGRYVGDAICLLAETVREARFGIVAREKPVAFCKACGCPVITEDNGRAGFYPIGSKVKREDGREFVAVARHPRPTDCSAAKTTREVWDGDGFKLSHGEYSCSPHLAVDEVVWR